MELNLTAAEWEAICTGLKQLHETRVENMNQLAARAQREKEEKGVDVAVIVTMNSQELKLFRRALAIAADAGEMDRTTALRRICWLDVLLWNAQEEAAALKAHGEK